MALRMLYSIKQTMGQVKHDLEVRGPPLRRPPHGLARLGHARARGARSHRVALAPAQPQQCARLGVALHGPHIGAARAWHGRPPGSAHVAAQLLRAQRYKKSGRLGKELGASLSPSRTLLESWQHRTPKLPYEAGTQR